MTDATSLVLRTGQKVLIDGRKAEARDFVDDGRVFLFPDTGTTLILSNVAQVRMAHGGRLTTQTSLLALSAGIRDAVETDLDAFAPEAQGIMFHRRRFIIAVEKLPTPDRRKKKCVQTAIDEQQGKEEENGPARKKPSVHQVKRWRSVFLASGRDIRSLVDLSYRRGRGDQLPPWVREEIQKAINTVYATQPPGTFAQTRQRAITLIRERAEREGRDVPMLGKLDPIGINVVQRVLKSDYEEYELLVARHGKAEADRIMEAVGVGPRASYPLERVEVDHTPLDILVVDDNLGGLLGRPSLTVLLDTYSRCLLGFCLSFHPPSWTTVMEALRVGVVDKSELLREVGGITSSWDCFGAPDELVSDNGKEFHSESMEATEAALNMRILYLPRRKGWLKGKIERWFGTLERDVIHKLPGTTLANVMERKHYDAEAAAVLTLRQLRWVVTKWIVDVYHHDDRNGRRVAPAELWARGMRDYGAKAPPPRELLVPLTGLTFPAHLSREGIKGRCLRWNSNAFSALRNRIGDNTEVLARIDPLDIKHAYVLDRANNKWVQGDLKTEDVDDTLTLHQYEVVRAHARKIREVGEDQRAALSRAHGEIFEYVKDITTSVRKSKSPKRLARFMTEGRKPHEHIAPSQFDADESAAPLGSHRIGRSGRRQPMPLLAPPASPPPAGRTIDQSETETPTAVTRVREPAPIKERRRR